MRLLTGPGVFTKRYASFTPGLAARLADTCLHELPRLLRAYALKLLKPRGSQHSLVQHLPRGGLYRGGSDRSRSSCATRPAASSPRTGCSAERVNKYTLGQCCSSLYIADFRKEP
jgi:hypothetical protein